MLDKPAPNKAAAIQRENAKKAKEHHAKEMEVFKDEMKEETARDLYSMSTTEKQMRGMPISTSIRFTLKGKKQLWWSKCCKAEAQLYRSIQVPGRETERFYRCKECYKDCEVQKTKPRTNSRS